MTLNEYAWKILRDHGCDEYTYGGEYSKDVLNDLKEAYPNGMEFPYVDVANEILSFSRAKPIVRAPFQMVWNTDCCSDGIDCDSYEAAKAEAEDLLVEWMVEEGAKWKNRTPTPEQIDDWNYMICNCYTEIYKYNPATDGYEEVDGLTYEDEERIGWKELPEQEE